MTTKKKPTTKKALAKKQPAKVTRKAKKLSDAQFWAILRKNAGIFGRTARMIEKEYGFTYSRQAVRERAMAHSDLLADIDEENVDIAEEGLHDLMRSGNPSVKLKAIETYLKAKGSHRGYYEKQKTQVVGDVAVTGRCVDGTDNS
jgi:hypothetical protein